ncbi:HlyC/CorC family transporter [Amylibacter sp. IMCC11727]|uniref:HlyC/CorC family transporter n=1 Tax=Amylibacter sp. IMCC11727 TaxID=3039851 RepID=UPI00244DB831|nr:HlyC/CorC family transporter [Amylibacter sp. IMCC11727]WGI20312.1 HlyC/CorC family transporter [Amylibacter sp. IMCC11727]
METAQSATVLMDFEAWMTVIAIICLLCVSAFFSGSETALTAASRGKLHSLADRGSTGANRALKLTENSERLIGAVLLGNNLVNILAASLATSLFLRLFGENGIAMATLVMTALVLVFAEVLPKTYAILQSEKAATLVSLPITIVVAVLSPIVAMVQFIVRGILSLIGVSASDQAEAGAAQAEIAGTIALGHVEGNVDRDDRDRLLGALDLKDREVEEIMLHRSDMEMIDANSAPQDIINQCLTSAYTRLPLWKDDPENIVGVVHAKDLLRAVNKVMRGESNALAALDDFNALDVAMKPYFVPETTTLDDQLREFLRRKTHFALVVDEYGALQGLITLEDIIEEIIGEISDEHDVDDQTAPQMDDAGNYVIDGAMTIRDLNRALEWSLPDDEANTIAGLVIHEAQMIPEVGQVFAFHRFRFEIAAREQNKITSLRIKRL